MQQARTTYRTVMHPRIKTQKQRSWTLTDYVAVPRLATIGTFRLLDMLSNSSIKAVLSAYADASAKKSV